MKFARQGLPFVIPLGLATLVANLLDFWWLGICLLMLTLAVAAFFRDPERDVPVGENRVVSPADGRVVAVDGEVRAEALPEETFQRVAIFMSPANVHVNRLPIAGEVLSVKHVPGRFLAAFDERSPIENERTEVVLRDFRGRVLVLVQVAGLLARRIICRLRPGQRVAQGDRFGLIMFGSRVDVYVSRSARICVRVGDRVRAGSGVLAEYPA
ncbi:MAG TPA: phosphatidylserine decarboxylase family protein [Candidatus Binatia bacterium]|nr:phosphatidylserine decarboxylase family protein [Candidatus Binatia bacterium]